MNLEAHEIVTSIGLFGRRLVRSDLLQVWSQDGGDLRGNLLHNPLLLQAGIQCQDERDDVQKEHVVER